jgi:hypothetical protein
MITYAKSAAVARLLNCPYGKLFYLIRTDRLQAPEKDSSGDYVWTPDDIARARAALAAPRKRRRKEVLSA